MSVYRDTNADVVFEHPHPGPLTATVYRNGINILEAGPVVSVAGRYTLPLTYKETQFDGQLDVVWTSSDELFTRTMSVDVITPLVALSRLKTLFKDTNWTDPELAELENSVRIFIQSYTRQTYGYELGSYSVTGTGESRVALPRRLIRPTNISGGPPAQYFTVSNNGWYLYMGNKNWLTIKEMPPDEFIDNIQVVSGVIHVPDAYWKQFTAGARYTITGEWGYYTVPEDVQEAAMILANDFGCGDSLYRDRYLDAVKASDWNLGFDAGAWRGTGNARADQLLNPYKKDMIIII